MSTTFDKKALMIQSLRQIICITANNDNKHYHKSGQPLESIPTRFRDKRIKNNPSQTQTQTETQTQASHNNTLNHNFIEYLTNAAKSFIFKPTIPKDNNINNFPTALP